MSTVLVADDDADIRELVSLRLIRSGYQTLTVADGATALLTACAQRPDLLLLDTKMPGLTGLEVCRRLRGEPETAAMPVILLTGYAADRDVSAAFDAGVDDYLTKPFSLRELVVRVESVLGRAERAALTAAKLAQVSARADHVANWGRPVLHERRFRA